ncbi:hypothetical protein [Falsiroseomonas sp.]|uniref:hypothetical protein n=1 Tax=Falsiroseomonas sp. TaxID=2870721 RepID=UPI0027369F58|nr:hypothetical protein [Falsiroseomonas sp.]MDP3417876.1 hypothetical protein [Falsiroseomonas sp.]
MPRSLILEFGWCGIGASGGETREVRFLLIRAAYVRGSVLQRLRYYRDVLRTALIAIPKNDPATGAIAALLDGPSNSPKASRPPQAGERASADGACAPGTQSRLSGVPSTAGCAGQPRSFSEGAR